MINDLTTNYNFQLPNVANTMAEDLPRIRYTITAIDAQIKAVDTRFNGVPVFADLTALSNTLNATITSTNNATNTALNASINTLRSDVPVIQNHALNIALGVI